ncbi:MAG: hypothetical protein HQK53_19060 [Oligoflexia bacterium]|nr:hypothetical protein [Oligoflexia bacterium]
MALCDDCVVKGYSKEICNMHLKHVASVNKKNKNKAKEKIQEKAQKKEFLIGNRAVKAALYGGASMLGVTFVIASAPVLGFGIIAHTIGIKVSAGILGGAVGSLKKECRPINNSVHKTM